MDPGKYDKLYMNVAKECASMSHARRRKVGAVLVDSFGKSIIDYGWNGMPTGMDNNCEYEMEDGGLVTRPEVQHAEMNIFSKLLRTGRAVNTTGATLYVTLAPCIECSKMILASGIRKVKYNEPYRDMSGVKLLLSACIEVSQYKEEQ